MNRSKNTLIASAILSLVLAGEWQSFAQPATGPSQPVQPGPLTPQPLPFTPVPLPTAVQPVVTAPVAPVASGPAVENEIQEARAAAQGIAIEVNTRGDSKPSGFVFGYRANTFMLAASFELGLTFAEQGLVESPLFGTHVQYTVGATFRVRFAASRDKRVELFGQGDLGFGEDRISGDNVDPISFGRTTYFVGPGLNYWLHANFALGGRVGFRGNIRAGRAATHELGTDSGLHVLAVF